MDLENRSVSFFCIERAVARADDCHHGDRSLRKKKGSGDEPERFFQPGEAD
jgi:hypothetical protein